MPPASPTGLQPPTGPGSRPATDRAARVRFRRAITLMVMTLFVPGSAQLIAGNKRVGRLAVRIWLAMLAVLAFGFVTAMTWDGFLFWLASEQLMLAVVQVAMLALAVGWAGLFMDAWRLGDPLSLHQKQRLAMVGVNGVLCFSVAGTLLFGAHVVAVQRDFVQTMFGDGVVSEAHDGRYNVLLMGGDSGAGRVGLRPDSMTVASIDAETGKTVLIGLPRNMQRFEFAENSVMDKEFPKGWNCDDCYLNSVSTWAEDNPELFKGAKHPGIDATKDAVEGITGLHVNYWAMVDLQGFKDLVDAFGGVTLNVRDQIPVGLPQDDFFHYIEPGKRKLDGMDTLWFARARYGSDDYSRMARQKCVMNAMVTQISPQDAVRRYPDIAKATSGMVSTDLPSKALGRFMQLGLMAKDQPISTLSLVPPMINTAEPDLDLVQKKVEKAIEKAEGDGDSSGGKKRRKRAGSGGTTSGGSLGSMDSGYAANESDNLASAC